MLSLLQLMVGIRRSRRSACAPSVAFEFAIPGAKTKRSAAVPIFLPDPWPLKLQLLDERKRVWKGVRSNGAEFRGSRLRLDFSAERGYDRFARSPRNGETIALPAITCLCALDFSRGAPGLLPTCCAAAAAADPRLHQGDLVGSDAVQSHPSSICRRSKVPAQAGWSLASLFAAH